MYLVGYFIVLCGLVAALWKLGVIDRVGPAWTAIGIVIAIGLGFIVAVSGSGNKETVEIDQKHWAERSLRGADASEAAKTAETGEIDMAGGKTDELTGRVKEAAGVLTDDARLKREGQLDQTIGKVKQAAEKMIDKVKDAAKWEEPGWHVPSASFYERQGKEYSVLTILLVICVLMLLGVLPTWPHSRGWGYAPSGGVGLIVLVLLVVLLSGRL
jgi:uncharacterized protein YjbJ (UPF0337 family)